jgi:hypothetical protein
MISFELAKQLKEAGFPQELGDGTELYDLGGGHHKWDYYSDKSYDLSKNGYYKIPTLIELIKTCEDDECFLLEKIPKGWIACCGTNPICVKDFSTSPEESVAKLWIKVNKKGRN